MKLTLDLSPEMIRAVSLVARFEGQDPHESALELADQGLKALLLARLQDQLELSEASDIAPEIEHSLGCLREMCTIRLVRETDVYEMI